MGDLAEVLHNVMRHDWFDQTAVLPEVVACCCAAATTVLGIEGWRAVFFSVAIVSAAIGVLNLAYAVDPNFDPAGEKAGKEVEPVSAGEAARQMWAVLTVPTFLIIVLQVSTAPRPPGGHTHR